MRPRALFLPLAALVLIVVAAFGHRLLSPPARFSAAPDPGCDLQQSACGAALPGGGRVLLSIEPHPIPLLKPMRLELTVTGFTATGAEIEFTGADMDMGIQRAVLTAPAPGRFSGEATLPVCVTGRMQWQAAVSLKSPQGDVVVPFRFFAPAQ